MALFRRDRIKRYLLLNAEFVSLETSAGVNRINMTKKTTSKMCLVHQEKQVSEKENEIKQLEDNFYNPGWTDEEKEAFAPIDRDQENKDVVAFQKTGDDEIFERIYENRIATLKVWARKYYYLVESADDMFGELSFCFVKATMTYDSKRGSFNTWLYTLLQNCVRNIRNGRKAKKRKPFGADPNSISNLTLSLDYNYNTKDGDESTLKDILSDEMGEDANVSDKMDLEETINILSKQDPIAKGFFRKLSDGNTVSSLIRELKIKRGRIKISRAQAKKLNTNRKCNRIVSDIIKDNSDMPKFNLVDYKITPSNRLCYTVELHKTEEADLMLKTIRNLRRDKDYLLSLING